MSIHRKEKERMSTWLITGCSSGLGRALAQAVLDAGHNAVITARNITMLADLAAAHPATALPLALDVRDHDQVVEVARLSVERFGEVDVLGSSQKTEKIVR
jgi:NADP-dependent 3-hydroxy acid dehydrogenase YdfG